MLDSQGFLPQQNCLKCDKPLNADGNHPAELYAGTFTGLCYQCEKSGAYTVKTEISGAKLVSHPPHCPSWRRDREQYHWFEDCDCSKGKRWISRANSQGGSYTVQCESCSEKHWNHPVIAEQLKQGEKRVNRLKRCRKALDLRYKAALKGQGIKHGSPESVNIAKPFLDKYETLLLKV